MKIGIKKTVDVDAKILKVHAKPCDSGTYTLVDAQGETIAEDDGYVPGFMPDDGGDYIVLDIEIETGRILNWQVPTPEQLAEWIAETAVE